MSPAQEVATKALNAYAEEAYRRARVERDPHASHRLKRAQAERAAQAYATFRIAFDRLAVPLNLAAVNGRRIDG